MERVRGFLGPLADRCEVAQGDVRDQLAIAALIREHGVTGVIHGGGLGSTRVNENPHDGFSVNVGGVLSLLEAARVTGVRRVVLVSSIFVYRTDPPLPLDLPVSEELPYRLPSNLYSAYKSAAEIASRAFARETGLSVINCRVAGAFGRGEFSGGGETGGLLQNLVIRAITEPPGPPIMARFRSGERIYAKDVADALVWALNVEAPPHDVYNVGSGEIVGAGNFAAALRDAVPGANIIAEDMGQSDTPLVDVVRAADELGYRPRWPLSRAIPDFIAQLRSEGIGRL
jgi:nucleoside-diphosphate-sugar epimerase